MRIYINDLDWMKDELLYLDPETQVDIVNHRGQVVEEILIKDIFNQKIIK